jgi:predicted ATPase
MSPTIKDSANGVHHHRLVVLTGGPGAGKTAVLELLRRNFQSESEVLPEAASILFGGGFPRRDDQRGRMAAQRAIFHVQCELEALSATSAAHLVVCDRGTLDGAAYWPGEVGEFFEVLGVGRQDLLNRYAAVIHLRTPDPDNYNHDNPLRYETPEEAAAIDARIEAAWEGHPRRFFVESKESFLNKAAAALQIIGEELEAAMKEANHTGESTQATKPPSP